MKLRFIFVALGFCFQTLPVQAQPGLRCSAVDRGSEEHWGGHNSCGECLREHGHCVEVCSLSFFTCEARGRDYQGNSISLKGSGSDRYEAERNAINFCERNFSNCSVYNCTSDSEQISRAECVRPPPPAPAPKPPAPAPKPPDRPDRPGRPDRPEEPGKPGRGGPGRPGKPDPKPGTNAVSDQNDLKG